MRIVEACTRLREVAEQRLQHPEPQREHDADEQALAQAAAAQRAERERHRRQAQRQHVERIEPAAPVDAPRTRRHPARCACGTRCCCAARATAGSAAASTLAASAASSSLVSQRSSRDIVLGAPSVASNVVRDDVAQQPAAGAVLGDAGVRDRCQPAVVVELVQAHVAQFQPAVAAVAALLRRCCALRNMSPSRAHTPGVLGDDHVVATSPDALSASALALAPRRERLAVDDHQQRSAPPARSATGEAEPAARQAQRAQRGQFRTRRQLAQPHQRADHRRGREQRVGAARHRVEHMDQRLRRSRSRPCRCRSNSPSRRPCTTSRPSSTAQVSSTVPNTHAADVEVVEFRERLHGGGSSARGSRARRMRPSRKYSHAANASSGSDQPPQARPAPAACLRPASRVPRHIRFMPTR